MTFLTRLVVGFTACVVLGWSLAFASESPLSDEGIALFPAAVALFAAVASPLLSYVPVHTATSAPTTSPCSGGA